MEHLVLPPEIEWKQKYTRAKILDILDTKKSTNYISGIVKTFCHTRHGQSFAVAQKFARKQRKVQNLDDFLTNITFAFQYPRFLHFFNVETFLPFCYSVVDAAYIW